MSSGNAHNDRNGQGVPGRATYIGVELQKNFLEQTVSRNTERVLFLLSARFGSSQLLFVVV